MLISFQFLAYGNLFLRKKEISTIHVTQLDNWRHKHNFLGTSKKNELKANIVLVIIFNTMLVEIITGYFTGSMALFADGWHMSTHALAMGITLFTYHYARKNKNNSKFSFGTGKVSSLGGFASSVFLIIMAGMMLTESISRFFSPVKIYFFEAIIVATIGLSVNILSVILLKENQHHEYDESENHDHNIKAAYLHVIADTFTSILAILALLLGKLLNINWLDPAC